MSLSVPLLLSLVTADAATLRVGPGQPYTTILGAVQAAASGDTVLVDAAVYTINRTIVVDKSLIIRGVAGIPELDAQDREIFDVTAGTVVIADMLLAPRGSHGVRIRGGDVTIDSVTISGNRNPNNVEGAAVRVDDANSVTITGSTFSDNRALAGGLFSTSQGGCVAAHRGTLVIRDSVFQECVSEYGGAVWTADTASLLVEDSTFTQNAADAASAIGGAIRAEGPLVIRRSTFSQNSATGSLLFPALAGAVYALFDAVIEDCTFSQNTSDGEGGAVRLNTASSSTLVRNLFCANSSTTEGGALAVGGSVRGWTLRNNLFVENEAPTGAAIAAYDDGAGVVPTGGVVQNNHFLGNDAGAGDAAVVLRSARVTVENNLFAGNPGVGLSDGTGPLNWSAWFQNGADLDGRAYGNADVRNRDPLVTSWSRDGDCLNDDFMPAAGSPLRNAGNPAITDPDGTRSDIGAWGGPDAPAPPVVIDVDADGFALGVDCDDNNNAVFPGASESCNNLDDDCDGAVDSPVPAGAPTFHPDGDGDGFGRRAGGVAACSAPAGYAASNDDCDDQRASAYPGAIEVCDGFDNDCDDLVDGDDAGDLPLWYPDNDGDGFGRPVADPPQGCEAPVGTVANGEDCDDGDADRNPGVVEVCDGVDQDCDGAVDDDPPQGIVFYGDADGDGWGEALVTTTGCVLPDGYAVAQGDCDDADRDVHPLAPEPCEPPRDMNCDGASGTTDNDGDSFGACEECDDFDSSRYPGAPDTWYDGVISDCDRLSDFDRDRDGFDARFAGGADCEDGEPLINPDAVDVADDGVDSNCDGVDEASVPVTPGGGDTDVAQDEEVDAKGCDGCDGLGGAGSWLLAGVALRVGRRRSR